MKLTNAKGSEVEVYGAETPEHVFQIQTSSIAFETLSSKLYSDRVTAIIRELACNAYDSHVVAGNKNKPFEVDLPTSLNPEFRIRDFGTGLADGDILELYCTYFASSKQSTNKQIGAFGIGSKSPFSYTQGFTVTSYQGGERRIYTAYINEHRVPAVVRLSTGSTTEPDGLEIKFAVKTTDILEFRNKAERVFEFFHPQPKFNYDINVVKTEYILGTKLWKIRNPNSDIDPGIRVIQGLVPYQLQGLTDYLLESNLGELHKLDLDIIVPIGTVSPAASRETLTNETKTVAKLNSLLQQIDRELAFELEKTIPAGTGWQKLNYLAKTYSKTSLKPIAVRLARNLVSDTGNLFGFKSISESTFPNLKVFIYRVNRYNTQVNREALLHQLGFSSLILEDDLITAEYVIVDIARLGNRRLEQYVTMQSRLTGNQSITVIAIFPNPLPRKSSEFDVNKHISESMDLIDSLGSPPVKKLSEIEIKLDTEDQSQTTVWYPKYWNSARIREDAVLTAKKMWIDLIGYDKYPDDDPSYYYIRTKRNFPIRFENYDIYRTKNTINSILTLLEIPGDLLFNLSANEKPPSNGQAVWIDLLEYFEDWAATYLHNNPAIVYNNTSELEELSYIPESDISPFSEARAVLTRTSLPPVHRDISAINSYLKSPVIEKAIEANIVFDYTLARQIYNDIISNYPLLASAKLVDLVGFYIETKAGNTCQTIQRTRLRQP